MLESKLQTVKYYRFCYVSESGKRVIHLGHMNLIILGIAAEKQLPSSLPKGHNDDDDDEDDDEDRPAIKGI